MKVIVRGKNVTITDAIEDKITKKLALLDKYFIMGQDVEAKVLIRTYPFGQKIEVTIPAKVGILRAEVEHDDLYAAIDKVSDKIERQIRKNKTRLKKKVNKDIVKGFALNFEEIEQNDDVIVRRKTIEDKPMSEEEAILQMELLGHEFFAFKNVETKDVNIIYKRKDGNYGILEIK